MVEKIEKKQAKKVFEGKEVKIYTDEITGQDGATNKFLILTIQPLAEGWYRDEKGTLCYGRRPAKAITFQSQQLKELKTAVGGL